MANETKKLFDSMADRINEIIVNGNKGGKIEVLTQLLDDIRNGTNKVGISMELSEKSRVKLCEYIENVIRREKNKAKKIERSENKEKEKQRRAEEAKRKEEEARKQEEEERRKEKVKARKQKIEQMWESLQETANKAIAEQTRPDSKFDDKSYLIPQIWRKLKDAAIKRYVESGKMEKLPAEIEQRFDDQIFYEEVKSFTHDFQFLSLNSLAALSTSSFSNRKIDSKCAQRLERLTKKIDITDSFNEKAGIRKLLASPKITEVERKILEGRLKGIIKEERRRIGVNAEDVFKLEKALGVSNEEAFLLLLEGFDMDSINNKSNKSDKGER